MAIKVYGYKWQLNYCGFDILFREYSGHTIAVLDAKLAERFGIEGEQFEFSDTVDYSIFDEFWEMRKN